MSLDDAEVKKIAWLARLSIEAQDIPAQPRRIIRHPEPGRTDEHGRYARGRAAGASA